MADTTGQDVGSFFKSLGEGITGIVGGYANQIDAAANYNNAAAAQINSNAATQADRLTAQQEKDKKELRLIIFVFIIVAAVPLIGLMLLKKKT